MDPILIGYFPKRRTLPADWTAIPGVDEVCSVSECIVPGPEGWVERWLHNDWGAFDTPERALETVPAEDRRGYALHAWEVFPVRFVGGVRRPLAVEGVAPTPLPDGFRVMGYDVVSRGVSSFFECSPLSCNGWAAHVGANRYCLAPDLEQALELAERAEREGCEPGDYFVVRVWRDEGWKTPGIPDGLVSERGAR